MVYLLSQTTASVFYAMPLIQPTGNWEPQVIFLIKNENNIHLPTYENIDCSAGSVQFKAMTPDTSALSSV